MKNTNYYLLLFFLTSISWLVFYSCENREKKTAINNIEHIEQTIHLDSFPEFQIFKKDKREPDLTNHFVQEAMKLDSVNLSTLQNYDPINTNTSIIVDLVKIRDKGDSTATPVLIDFLEKTKSQGNSTYRFVALQAFV